MSTKKLQVLDYKIKQAENADTIDGKHALDFATATDMDAAQSSISDLQTKVGDTSVSDQIATGLANKVDKVDGKGLSTHDYTTDDKDKLSGIAMGAEVNQNTFSNIAIGNTTIFADTKTDTLTFEAGSNVILTPDVDNDKITIDVNAMTTDAIDIICGTVIYDQSEVKV